MEESESQTYFGRRLIFLYVILSMVVVCSSQAKSTVIYGCKSIANLFQSVNYISLCNHQYGGSSVSVRSLTSPIAVGTTITGRPAQIRTCGFPA
jgi:hypothetical protein